MRAVLVASQEYCWAVRAVRVREMLAGLRPVVRTSPALDQVRLAGGLPGSASQQVRVTTSPTEISASPGLLAIRGTEGGPGKWSGLDNSLSDI